MTGRAGWGAWGIHSRHKLKASTVAGQQVTTGKGGTPQKVLGMPFQTGVNSSAHIAQAVTPKFG
jgi:hypothetical protein